jgi:hypothetical protein
MLSFSLTQKPDIWFCDQLGALVDRKIAGIAKNQRSLFDILVCACDPWEAIKTEGKMA